jgi:hypothetical protein
MLRYEAMREYVGAAAISWLVASLGINGCNGDIEDEEEFPYRV